MKKNMTRIIIFSQLRRHVSACLFYIFAPIMAGETKYTIPIQLVELEDENYHIIIEGTLNNGKALQWVIDTGASKTVFDANLAEHFDADELEATEIQSAGIGEGRVDTQTGILHEIY
ncbi:MAG TPA: aspartyl protease family protein, partial [Prolixibacteraceae bacterium]|nr:aspartyl protease family protein [Prolixibacteraceae bacterium]